MLILVFWFLVSHLKPAKALFFISFYLCAFFLFPYLCSRKKSGNQFLCKINFHVQSY
ncbi:hypothetical protein HMPREF0971_02774 [Segatella oris F0302]|uniref:Uncharacterized protein n=1 Tax=Segatella oris F0302 TaxID=649760 RepID=D1QUT9_9BACT|nr:hypothetical protein HMPREF0971_02774 [Segatella oris F0302]